MSACVVARSHREPVHRAAPKTSAVAIACCVGDACALDVLHALDSMKEAAAGVKDKSLDAWIDAARRVDERIIEIVTEDATLLRDALALEPHQRADAGAVVSARDIWYRRLGDAWHDTRYSASEIDRTLGALDDLASAASAVLDESVLGALQDEAKAWREAGRLAAMAPAVDRLAKRLEAAVETLGGMADASTAIRDTYTLMRSNSFGHIMAALTRSPQHSAIAVVFACLMDDVVAPGLNIIDVMDRAIDRVCLPAACAVADDSPTD